MKNRKILTLADLPFCTYINAANKKECEREIANTANTVKELHRYFIDNHLPFTADIISEIAEDDYSRVTVVLVDEVIANDTTVNPVMRDAVKDVLKNKALEKIKQMRALGHTKKSRSLMPYFELIEWGKGQVSPNALERLNERFSVYIRTEAGMNLYNKETELINAIEEYISHRGVYADFLQIPALGSDSQIAGERFYIQHINHDYCATKE